MDEEEQESISILNSDGDIEADTGKKETRVPIKLVTEPKIFREKGKEMVYDAKNRNSIKRPAVLGKVENRKSFVVVDKGSIKSMEDESFSDENTEHEETKHDT